MRQILTTAVLTLGVICATTAPPAAADQPRFSLADMVTGSATGAPSLMRFGAEATGSTDAAPAFRRARDRGPGLVFVPAGTYRLDSDVDLDDVSTIFDFSPGATLVGAGAIRGAGFADPTGPGRMILGKITQRAGIEPDAPGFRDHPGMGQLWRGDVRPEPGQVGWFLSGDGKSPVIAGTDYVGLHTRHDNSAHAPRIWGMNPVVVKNLTAAASPTGSASAIGMEISVSNNTDETPLPQRGGTLEGMFISYIHTGNRASAALSTGGLTAGWNNGIWIDGVAPDGTHIDLRDEVSANQGVRRGINTTGTRTFADGAIVLGNDHRIVGSGTDGRLRDLARVSSDNRVTLADPDLPARVEGSSIALAGPAALVGGRTDDRRWQVGSGATRAFDPGGVTGFLRVLATDNGDVWGVFYFDAGGTPQMVAIAAAANVRGQAGTAGGLRRGSVTVASGADGRLYLFNGTERPLTLAVWVDTH